MFLNLLAAAFDPSLKNKKISVGEAAIDAVVGLAVVFIGIALLVFIVWGVGQIMQKSKACRKPRKPRKNRRKPRRFPSLRQSPRRRKTSLTKKRLP